MESRPVPSVLVVDDEPRVRQFVAKVLRRRGLVVLEAEDARAALRLFGHQASDIALLLTDLVMPGMTGEELADLLRDERPDLEVIFMSGYGEDELVERGVARVGARYLTKPFSPDVLTMMVEGVLGR